MADFNIEEFPTSPSAQQMIGRVSPIYRNSYVGKWLFQVMGLEMDEARALVESLRDQCYLEKCTWGMRYWEERYGIEVDETKDLEGRRATVAAKRRKREALTPATLEALLESLTGRNVDILEDNSKCRFTVLIHDGETQVDCAALMKRLDAIKPSHLAYSIKLLRKKTLTHFLGTAVREGRRTSIGCAIPSDQDAGYLADENGSILTDEAGRVLLIRR